MAKISASAIYVAREDGDWDLLAAYDVGLAERLLGADMDALLDEQVREIQEESGADAKLVDSMGNVSDFPDVLGPGCELPCMTLRRSGT